MSFLRPSPAPTGPAPAWPASPQACGGFLGHRAQDLERARDVLHAVEVRLRAVRDKRAVCERTVHECDLDGDFSAGAASVFGLQVCARVEPVVVAEFERQAEMVRAIEADVDRAFRRYEKLRRQLLGEESRDAGFGPLPTDEELLREIGALTGFDPR